MIRAVASAFISLWEGFMNTFLQKTFNGDYSIAMWLANLIPVIMVFAAFIINMLFIPNDHPSHLRRRCWSNRLRSKPCNPSRPG